MGTAGRPNSRHGENFRLKGGRRKRLRLQLEQLEDRRLLAGDFCLPVTSPGTVQAVDASYYDQVSPEWFTTLVHRDNATNIVLGFNSAQNSGSSSSETIDPNAKRWSVRFKPESLIGIDGVADTESLLATNLQVEFIVMRGLGLPGQIEVETVHEDQNLIEATLTANPHVDYYQLDSLVLSQGVPNDPLFDQQWGLENHGRNQLGRLQGIADSDVDIAHAWNISTGSHSVAVGIVDSGIDYTHPDLYQNIWINQAEIPEGIASSLTDVDGDGRFSFVDLNDAANATFVTDGNATGYIDAGDLIVDPSWFDGVDTAGNGFVDDLFGYDFTDNNPNPSDDSGHGTHVAEIIGASGNNGIGISGVAHSVSLVALKFLNGDDLGSTADATRALNYAVMMRQNFNEPIHVLNNSWGGDR